MNSNVKQLQAVKKVNHPFVLVCLYMCNVKISAQGWQFLLHEAATFEENVIIYEDFNANSRLWGNTCTNKQGVELENALVSFDLMHCISMTAG